MWKRAKDSRQPHPFHLVPSEVSKAILKAKIDPIKVIEDSDLTKKAKTSDNNEGPTDFTDIS